MANIASARKRARQSEKRRQHNVSRRSLLRTRVKNVVKALDAGDTETARSAIGPAGAILDRAAGNGLIHKNKAARHKSRLNARLKALSAQA